MSEPYHRAEDAFSEIGAARAGGRWNSSRTRVVYASGSLALASLERLIHTFSVRGLEGLWVHTFHFEEADALRLPDDQLPEDWNRKPVPPDWHAPPPKLTQQIGDDWAARQASLLLRVPSAVLPQEHNYLINPLHPSFALDRLEPAQQFRFDERVASLLEPGAEEGKIGKE